MDMVIDNLSKKYNDKVVLNNFSNTFKDNSITFITGTSRMGKTTLIRILMYLGKADSGNITGISHKKISTVFQDDNLCKNLSVLLNIKLVCEDLSDLEIENALELLDLKDCINKRVRELSGGMKRRIAILRTLLYDFYLLIMDEPFKGLDMETKYKVKDFVISKMKNKSAIIITHDIDDIRYFRSHKESIIDFKMPLIY
ncbi:hypothetical protein KW94_03880 [Clostridioides difficile]|nr:hypothetical protein KW94_03880 [Clostridioides difficile]